MITQRELDIIQMEVDDFLQKTMEEFLKSLQGDRAVYLSGEGVEEDAAETPLYG